MTTKSVPLEPTQVMSFRGGMRYDEMCRDTLIHNDEEYANAIYAAMLSAAPVAPSVLAERSEQLITRLREHIADRPVYLVNSVWVQDSEQFIEEAATALEAALATEEWMPIETAPKDGSRVMLTCEGYKGAKDRSLALPDDYQDIVHLARFDGEYWYPYIPNEWTHWKPIGSPPAKS